MVKDKGFCQYITWEKTKDLFHFIALLQEILLMWAILLRTYGTPFSWLIAFLTCFVFFGISVFFASLILISGFIHIA